MAGDGHFDIGVLVHDVFEVGPGILVQLSEDGHVLGCFEVGDVFVAGHEGGFLAYALFGTGTLAGFCLGLGASFGGGACFSFGFQTGFGLGFGTG